MKNNIEKIKTLVLWLLFISSIALLIIRYNLISFSNISGESGFYNDAIFQNIIIPKHISVKFGQYDITEILVEKKPYYDEIKQSISLGLRHNEGIKKIERIDYEEAKKGNNVLVIYNNLPAVYIEKSVGLKNTAISNLGYIDEICLILGKNEMYIKDTDGYYMISTESENPLGNVERLKTATYDKFYPKFENLNSKSILLPLTLNMSMKNVEISSILEEQAINNIAQNILRDRFDFSSSIIQKNGVYFYSYNNGQEILKINKNGYLEYKRESVEHVQDDIEKSTKAMLSFLFQLGINDGSIVIDSVKKVGIGSKKVYEFSIKHQKDGIVAEMSTKFDDGIIKVVGDNVISANIILKNVGEYIGGDNIISDPSKALDSRIEYIKKTMNQKDVSVIISMIDDISLVYLRDESEILVPAWRYEMNGYVFLIDAINGDVYSYAMGKI